MDGKKLITRFSKNKHRYTASELLKHLCKIFILLQDVKEVPSEAPIKLPTRPDNYALGTKSADLLGLDNAVLTKEERIRLKAMLSKTEGRMVDLAINHGDAANKLGN